MSADDGHLIWGISLVIHCILVSSSDEQQLHGLHAALTRSQVEGSVTQTVLCRHVGTVVYQELNVADVAVLGSLVQLSVEVGVTDVDLAVVHQQSEAGREVVAHDSSVVQGGETLQFGESQTICKVSAFSEKGPLRGINYLAIILHIAKHASHQPTPTELHIKSTLVSEQWRHHILHVTAYTPAMTFLYIQS